MRIVSLRLLAFFLIAQALALFTGARFLAQELSVVEDPSNPVNSLFFFAYIIAATAVLLLVLKFYKGKRLFLGVELLLVFTTVQVFVYNALGFSETVALLAGGAAVCARLALKERRNAFLLFAVAIVGALLGASLDVLPAVILSVALAGYDVFAVFYSKHMVTLAKSLEKRGAAFAVSLRQGKERVQLGTGDVVMPAMLSVSLMRFGLGASLASVVGSVAGLVFIVWVLEKNKGYWPALPPLVFGNLLFAGAWLALQAAQVI